jgi:hypothetical protein
MNLVGTDYFGYKVEDNNKTDLEEIGCDDLECSQMARYKVKY